MAALRLICRAALGREASLAEHISNRLYPLSNSSFHLHLPAPTVISLQLPQQSSIVADLQAIAFSSSCLELSISAAELPLDQVQAVNLRSIDWQTPFDHWRKIVIPHFGTAWADETHFAVRCIRIALAQPNTGVTSRSFYERELGRSFQESSGLAVRCKRPELTIRGIIADKLHVGFVLPKESLIISPQKNISLDGCYFARSKSTAPPLVLNLEQIQFNAAKQSREIEMCLNDTSLHFVDVRSPKEFAGGHIPGASNIPLLSDSERHSVGHCYANKGREAAIELGCEIVRNKQERLLQEFQERVKVNGNDGKRIVVYCARGGLRSSTTCWWLRQNGIEAELVSGGYKAFRQWIGQSYEASLERRLVCVIGGKTGSGKTRLLQALQERGAQVIDLERMAKHAGSAFGSIPFEGGQQPTSEQFANDLGVLWHGLRDDEWIFVEDEGSHIGRVSLPPAFYKRVLRSAALVLRLHVPVFLRARNLVEDYASESLRSSPATWSVSMKECVHKLARRLGKDRYVESIKLLEEENFQAFAELLLTYYDKLYEKHIALEAHAGSQPSQRDALIVDVKVDGLTSSEAAILVLDKVGSFNPYQTAERGI